MIVGILRYRCSLCPRVYTTRRGLRTHIKYHSTDRPHSCPTCNASFKVRSKLADHIKLVHIQKVLRRDLFLPSPPLSTLEVFLNGVHYINSRFTYLFTYLASEGIEKLCICNLFLPSPPLSEQRYCDAWRHAVTPCVCVCVCLQFILPLPPLSEQRCCDAGVTLCVCPPH